MQKDQKKEDGNEKTGHEKEKLIVKRNMCTSTIGLNPLKPWDPMETEPEEHRGGLFYLGK